MTSSNEQDNFDRLAGLQGGGTSQPPSTPQEPFAKSSETSPPLGQKASPASAQNGLSTAALALGIVAIVPLFTFVSLVCGVLAIIFGAIGRKQARLGVATKKVQATWGLWLGVVAVLISLITVMRSLTNMYA